MKVKIGVLFGGKSVEHEVSVITGIQAIENIDKEKYDIIPIYMTKTNEMYVGKDIGNIEKYKNIPELLKSSERVVISGENGRAQLLIYKTSAFKSNIYDYFDIAFPIVHGTDLEGGALYGFFKILNVPCVGSDVLSSSISMDKHIAKCILKEKDIPVLNCLCFDLKEYKTNLDGIIKNILDEFGFPVIIKPVDSGSSVGISIAKNEAELEESIDEAFKYSKRILAEHAISNMREINCSVLGDYEYCIASECEEPIKSDEILSYKDKYISGGKKIGGDKGMNVAGVRLPANISDDIKNTIQDLAQKTFRAVGSSGVVRIDFMIDNDNNKIYVNEINTIPGCLSFHLWKASNLQYKDLLNNLIDITLKRQREEDSILYSFDTNMLQTISISNHNK